LPEQVYGLLAQVNSSPADWGTQQSIIVNLVIAIAILVIGWLIAALVATGVRGLLRRTRVDNQLVNLMAGQPQAVQPNVEQWTATLVFWVVMLLAIVAALNALNLTTVSQPLNTFLNQILGFLPRLGSAAVLIGIAWILATTAKTVVTRMAGTLGLDERLAAPAEGASSENQFLFSQTLGNFLYWFILLFFLPLILGVLQLEGALQPVQNLLNEILAALPNLIKAGLFAVIGWLIARVVRMIVTNLLATTGIDRLGTKVGLDRTQSAPALSGVIGTIVYVLILVPTAIAALEALQIKALSAPAESMLNSILQSLPKIFTAGLILVLAYVVGQLVSELVSTFLMSIGFNRILTWLGFPVSPPPIAPPTPPLAVEATQPATQVLPRRTPSEIAGIVVLVAILLLATVAATQILELQVLTEILKALMAVLGRVFAGLVVFGVGLYLATLAFNLISSSGGAQSRLLGNAARIAIIALVSSMALHQIGIAPDLINLVIGLLLGGVALGMSIAIAIAFGWGGRAIASELLQEWLAAFRQNQPPSQS
jgi:hypothetical protein